MCGKLPSRRQLAEFQHTIGLERALPDNFTEDMIMRAPSRDIMNSWQAQRWHCIPMMRTRMKPRSENIMRQGISLMAKFPVIISHAYQAKRRYFDNDSMFLHVPDRTVRLQRIFCTSSVRPANSTMTRLSCSTAV